MNQNEHIKRHQELHKAVNELAADYMYHHPMKLLSETTVLDLLKWSRDPGTSQERHPRDVVPARMFELAKTLKEKLILALGPSDDGYMSIDEVSTLIREPVDRVQSGLRDLRAKYRLLDAPENNTWRLNDKGRAEYERQAFQRKDGNMKHESFPVNGFDFMNEPATDEQKKLILEICKERQIPVDPNGPWPEPFSKWDAGQMIDTLKGKKT